MGGWSTRGRGQRLLTAAVVSILTISLVAFAGTSAAVDASVTGPGEVTSPGTVDVQSVVDVRGSEDVRIESFTLTVRPAGSPGEEVAVTVGPNGTVRSVAPERGVAGEGEIRIAQLRRSLNVTVSGATPGYGYGYGYGDVSITVDASFSSTALKHGEYELFLSVNTPSAEGQYRSSAETFEVLVPGEGSPPDRGEGTDARGGPADGPRRGGVR